MEVGLEQRGQTIMLIEAQALGSGGQARVFPVEAHPEWAAKVYHKADFRHAAKLAVMVANPPEDPMAARGHASIAWPLDLLVDSAGTVVGFLMPRVNGTRPIIDYFNPKTRRQACPGFNYFYLLRTARNLAAALHAVHSRGYVVGDINETNILVSPTALVTLVDTDSFQVYDHGSGECYRCPVGRLEYSAPEVLARVGQGLSYASMDRVPEQDLFGLAVLLFQLLMEGTHPFAGVYKGRSDAPTYSERILAGHFAYYQGREVPYQPAPLAPPFELLHPWLRQAFLECFVEGQKQPGARHGALAWVRLLDQVAAEVIYCGANAQHAYWPHLKSCPWCARGAKLGGRDPFPALASAPPPSAVMAPVASGAVAKPPVSSPSKPPQPTPRAGATSQPKPAAKPVVRIVTSRPPAQTSAVPDWLANAWSQGAGLCRRYNVMASLALALALCALICFSAVPKPWSSPPPMRPAAVLGSRLLRSGHWISAITLAVLAVIAGYAGRFLSPRFRGRGRVASSAAIGVAVGIAALTIVLLQLARYRYVLGPSRPSAASAQPGPRIPPPPVMTTPPQVRHWSFQSFRNVQTTGPRFGGSNGEEADVLCVSFAAGNRQLVIGTRVGAQVWDVPNSRLVRWFPPLQTKHEYSQFTSIALSSNSQMLALAADPSSDHKDIEIWDYRTGLLSKQLSPSDSGRREVVQMAFSSNERRLAVGLRSQAGAPDIQIWDLEQQRVLCDIRAPPATTDLNGSSGQGSPNCIVFSPDGTLVAAGLSDKSSAFRGVGAVYIWNATDGSLRHALTPAFAQNSFGEKVRSLAFSSDGQVLAAGYGPASGRGAIRLWNSESGKLQRPLALTLQQNATCEIPASAFSPDGRWLVSGYAASFSVPSLLIWDMRTDYLQGVLPVSTDSSRSGAKPDVRALAFSADGNSLAYGLSWPSYLRDDKQAAITLLNTEDWSGRWRLTRSDLTQPVPVTALALSPDGTTLACAYGGRQHRSELTLWMISRDMGNDRATPSGTMTGSTNSDQDALISVAAFSPDGNKLATVHAAPGLGLELRIHRVPALAQIGRLELAHAATAELVPTALSIAFGPSGSSLLCLLARVGDPPQAQVWNLNSNTLEHTFVLPERLSATSAACVGFLSNDIPVVFFCEVGTGEGGLRLYGLQSDALLKTYRTAPTASASAAGIMRIALAQEAQVLALMLSLPDYPYRESLMFDLQTEEWSSQRNDLLAHREEKPVLWAISSRASALAAKDGDNPEMRMWTLEAKLTLPTPPTFASISRPRLSSAPSAPLRTAPPPPPGLISPTGREPSAGSRQRQRGVSPPLRRSFRAKHTREQESSVDA
jgi:WD40 repeat protein